MLAPAYLTANGWRERHGFWMRYGRRGKFSLERAVSLQIEERRAFRMFEVAYLGGEETPVTGPVVVNVPLRSAEKKLATAPAVKLSTMPWAPADADLPPLAMVPVHPRQVPPTPLPAKSAPAPKPEKAAAPRSRSTPRPPKLTTPKEGAARRKLTPTEKAKRILPMLLGSGDRQEQCVLYEDHMDVAAKLNVSARCPTDCAEFQAYDRKAMVSYLARSQRAE